MAEVTYQRSVGLVLPDVRATLDAASTYTEADPVPGLVEPQQASGLTLTASGEAPATTLLIRTQQGGIVAGDNPARFVWRASTTTGDFFGADEPYSWSTHQHLVTAGPAQQVIETRDPHAIRLPDGRILAVYQRRHSVLSPAYTVHATILALDGSTSSATVYSSTSAPSQAWRPAACVLPNGRILVATWSADAGSSTAQVRIDYSDDDGATWAMASEAALPAAFSTATYGLRRIRLAALEGGVALFVHVETSSSKTNHRDEIRQYASRDLGHHFALVDVSSDTDTTVTRRGGALLDAVASGGYLVVGYVAADDLGVYACRVGSPYESIWDTAPVAVDASGVYATESGTPSLMAAYDGAASVDESGAVYLTARHNGSGFNNAQRLFVTRDQSRTWTSPGRSDLPTGNVWARTQTTATYISQVALANTAGRNVAIFVHDASTTTYEGTLWSAALGGDSTVTLPPYNAAEEAGNQVTYAYTWWPADLPSTWGYTSVVGAGTSTLAAHYVELATTANTRYYEDSLPNASSTLATYGVIRRFRYAIPAAVGGTLTSTQIGVYIRIRDAVRSYEVEIRLTGTGARCHDVVAGATVGSDVSGLTAGTEYEWIVAVSAGLVRTWYRAWTWQGLTAWTAGPAGSLTAGASGAAGATIRWGNITSGTQTSRWYSAATAWDLYTGAQLTAAQVNPDDLRARPYSPTGTAVGSTGTLVSAEGYTTRGDDYHVGSTSDRPIQALLAGSVRQEWASSTTTTVTLDYELSGSGDSRPMSDVLVVGGFSGNIGRVQIYGVSSTSLATLLVDQNLSAGMDDLPWTRSGDRIRPDAGAANNGDTPAFYHGELDGSQFSIWTGSAWHSRKIRRNAGGSWNKDAGVNRETLFLEGSVSAIGSSGTDARIVPRDWAVLVSTRGVQFETLRIVIPAPDANNPMPADGYWRLGRLVVGYLHLAAYGASWGARVTEEARTEIVTSRDDQRAGVQLAGVRRRCRFGWVDGTNVYRVLDAEDGTVDGSTADWFRIDASGESMGWRGVELHTQGSILRITRGGLDPIVYLPHVDPLSGPTKLYNRRDQLVLGYIDGPVARDLVTGLTQHGELLRGDVIEVVED